MKININLYKWVDITQNNKIQSAMNANFWIEVNVSESLHQPFEVKTKKHTWCLLFDEKEMFGFSLDSFSIICSQFNETGFAHREYVRCNAEISRVSVWSASLALNKTLCGKLSNVQLRCYHGRLDAASCQQLT